MTPVTPNEEKIPEDQPEKIKEKIPEDQLEKIKEKSVVTNLDEKQKDKNENVTPVTPKEEKIPEDQLEKIKEKEKKKEDKEHKDEEMSCSFCTAHIPMKQDYVKHLADVHDINQKEDNSTDVETGWTYMKIEHLTDDEIMQFAKTSQRVVIEDCCYYVHGQMQKTPRNWTRYAMLYIKRFN